LDLLMAGHLNTPLEMTVSRVKNQALLDIKIPSEVERETGLLHLFVKPFTFKKNLRDIAPITQSRIKAILSGEPLKKMSLNIGAPLEIDAKIVAESDAEYTDLYSYLEQIRKHSPISLIRLGALPFSMRKSSLMVLFNPETSMTREVSVAIGLEKHAVSEPLSEERLAHFCSKAESEAQCPGHFQKLMSSLEKDGHSNGHMVALRFDALLVGTNKQYSTAIAIGYSTKSTNAKDGIAIASEILIKTPTAPVYEIGLLSLVEIPRVNILKNKEQLLQQALEVIIDGRAELGYMTKKPVIVEMRTILAKSQQQIESVRTSPEFLRCTQEEQHGRPFAEDCEIIRHQSASVDEIRTDLVIPAVLRNNPQIRAIVPNIVNVLKTLFVGHLIETQVWDPAHQASANEFKMVTKISRVGHEAQVAIEHGRQKYQLINIRIPALLKGVLPLSLRTPIMSVGLNRLNKLVPATCHVGPAHIRTFDSKMVNYQLNDCFHLLFRDCSEKIPVAVMARNLPSTLKEVKVLAGIAEVLLTPISATEMKIQLNLNGQQEIVTVQPGELKVIKNAGLEILQIKLYQDNVYQIHAVQEGLVMFFDGKNAQIFGNALLKSRSCGLCGDLNAETTADLKTPERCIMSSPKLAAYSYMIQESTCQGIPSQDLAIYKQEKDTCIKQEVIPTIL